MHPNLPRSRDLPPTAGEGAVFPNLSLRRGQQIGSCPTRDAHPAMLGLLGCAPVPTRIAALSRVGAAVRGWWGFARACLAIWAARLRSRRELLTLGPIELADICLTRTDAQVEARKWFWQK
jgi:uncharacterized protein YjiS (DUF1127 family)